MNGPLRVWLALLDAALDQPNPTPALKRAIDRVQGIPEPGPVKRPAPNRPLRSTVAKRFLDGVARAQGVLP